MPSITKPRWMKTNDERLQDVLGYIAEKLTAANATEISNIINIKTQAQQKTLGGLLSLGATGTATQRTQDRQERRAKRALLLMANLFINNLVHRQGEIARIKALPENSEANLLSELSSWFTLPNITPGMVADNAATNIARMPNWQNININPALSVRGFYAKGANYEFNCYNAVVFWAFQAGAISRRFLWNKLHEKDGNAFFPIFSRCGWTTNIEYSFASNPPREVTHDYKNTDTWDIPKGMAVYYVTPHKKFGHVALSLGNGKIISQNAVIPAKRELIKPEDTDAVAKMNSAITHVISIKNFWDIHYHPENGYHKLQHTTRPFWEAFPAAER